VCTLGPNADSVDCSGNDGPSSRKCVRQCKPGFIRDANGFCTVACNTPAACGTDCHACAEDPHGDVSCSGNTEPSQAACQKTCDDNYQEVDGICVSIGWISICLPGACRLPYCTEGCGGGGGGGGGIDCWGVIESVDHADEDHIVVAGSGCIFASSDGGATWNAKNVGLCGLEVSYPSLGAAYVTARSGGLFKSTDQGGTWSTVAVASGDMRRVHFSDAAHGLVAGATALGAPLVYRTTDGGGAFTLLTTPLVSAATGVFARDLSRLFLAAGQIHRSTNSGSSWDSSCTGCGARVVVAPTNSRVYASNNCSVLVSTNGGGTFTDHQVICDFGQLYGVNAPTAMDVWTFGAVGPDLSADGVIYYSGDGGSTFSGQAIEDPMNAILDLDMASTRVGTAVGPGWQTFITTGGGN
jgi:photosystem II stability/assembly factor-like uncharacterized protein